MKIILWVILFVLASAVEADIGYINGQTFQHKKMEYTEVDGFPMFQGDIILDLVDASAPLARGLIIVGAGNMRWPNGVIPYIIQPSLTPIASQNFHAAMAEWENKTGIRFKDVSNSYTQGMDVVSIMDGSGCASNVGRRGGGQFIFLNRLCSVGNAIHEIGHTVGLWHEQSRADRNSFITINWVNIIPAYQAQFAQHISDGDDAGNYDYYSIMHYPKWGFSSNGGDTYTQTYPTPGFVIGEGTQLSMGDAAATQAMYRPVNKDDRFLKWAESKWRKRTGDFNGDGYGDILQIFNRWFIIAFGQGNGGYYTVSTKQSNKNFGSWTYSKGMKTLICDLDGDGFDDIHLVGGRKKNFSVSAFSDGTGGFRITGHFASKQFYKMSQQPRIATSCKDMDGDGMEDVVLVGGRGWKTIPVNYSNGDGTFNYKNGW